MIVIEAFSRNLRGRFPVVVLLAIAVLGQMALGQVSPEEHAEHHPNQTQGDSLASKPGDDSKPSPGGGMMGGKGGGMGGMMEKMGATKPQQMYAKLMSFPDLPMEERVKIGQEAKRRMTDGTALLSTGLDELSTATDTDDFQAMQNATSRMREGLAQFESGQASRTS